MTDRLDATAVGLPTRRRRSRLRDSSAEARARRRRVPTRKGHSVKGVDRGAVESAKADMRAGNRRPYLRFAGNCELNAGRPRRGIIIGTTALAEINDTDKAKRTRYCAVETTTAIDVGDTEREHDPAQHSALKLGPRGRSANSHKLAASAA